MGRVFVVWLQLILLPALYGGKKKGKKECTLASFILESEKRHGQERG